jgi:hypothetical protein
VNGSGVSQLETNLERVSRASDNGIGPTITPGMNLTVIALANVCYWYKADIVSASKNVRFWG